MCGDSVSAAVFVNVVELPKAWWPNDWFYDEGRTQPKYVRPTVPLHLAEAQSKNIWENGKKGRKSEH